MDLTSLEPTRVLGKLESANGERLSIRHLNTGQFNSEKVACREPGWEIRLCEPGLPYTRVGWDGSMAGSARSGGRTRAC